MIKRFKHVPVRTNYGVFRLHRLARFLFILLPRKGSIGPDGDRRTKSFSIDRLFLPSPSAIYIPYSSKYPRNVSSAEFVDRRVLAQTRSSSRSPRENTFIEILRKNSKFGYRCTDSGDRSRISSPRVATSRGTSSSGRACTVERSFT